MIERGKEWKVLDKGFVRFIDHMGGDEDIVEAARVSTGRGFVSWEPYKRCKLCNLVTPHQGDHGPIHWDSAPMNALQGCHDEDGKKLSESHDWENFPRGDLGILDYLMKNRHSSPFEMVEIKVQFKCPMDIWRQIIRHRTASVNEYSTRYSHAIDDMAETAPDKWRTQGVTNRQGSGAYLSAGEGSPILRAAPDLASNGEMVDFSRQEAPGSWLSRREKTLHEFAREVYEDRLALGVAKEQARKDLPLSNYTEAYWKIDLHNLFHFLGLRMHSHAQEETRAYANVLGEIAKMVAPRAFDVWEEHAFYGVHLSRTEAKSLRALLSTIVHPDERDTDGAKILKKLGA